MEEKVNNSFKFGVVYLSYIPDGLNVKILRQIMSQFGDVGRVYLEPDGDMKNHKYSEGWIEFKKKRIAKMVAKTLDGTAIEYGKRRCKLNGQIWNIKYLHRFKWAHLTEQLNYDRKVQDQRRRFGIVQAKKQADFYQKMTEKARRNKKLDLDKQNGSNDGEEDEGTSKKRKLKALKFKQKEFVQKDIDVDEDLLSSIFKKVVD